MMNEPIYGCQTCNTTVGRNSCWEHRDKPKVLIADIPKATLEISIRDAKIAELEAALAEEKERWIQEREAWIAQKAECVTLQEKLAEAEEDSKRLDWLDQFIQCGCADFGFELDGGVYLQLNSPGAETVNIREANDARAAIDAARKEQP